MKVIQIIPQFGMGGAEIMCENLVYALREQGVDVSVISLYDFQSPITKRLEKKNIKVIADIKMPIAIPAVDISESKEYIFTNNHS